MNLKELTTPIQMYWDIGPNDHIGPSDYQRIADEIAANKFLSLQITEAAPILSEAVLTVIKALADKPIALSLVLTRPAVDDQVLGLLRRFHLAMVFLTTSSLDELIAVLTSKGRKAGTQDIGVSFPVSRSNYRDLPAVLSNCAGRDIQQLLLPMQRLATGEKCFWLTAEERKELDERLKHIDRPAGLKITIHDPFLWKTFNPSVDFPGGGCQAANTMLYISTEGDVYPCPSFPMKLGSLIKGSLGEILKSDGKKDLRKMLISHPRECTDCDEREQCRGGCRGRSYRAGNSVQSPDPACGGNGVT